MQTLEINYKAVFNALPGQYVLLLGDIPFFSIAAISDDYLQSINLNREEAIGKRFIDVLADIQNGSGVSIRKKLFDSLENVMLQKKLSTVRSENISSSDEIANPPSIYTNTPVLSPEGEVLYIIHSLIKETSPSAGNNLSKIKQQDKIVLDKLIDQSPVAIGILSGKEMVIETANDPMLEIFGKGDHIIGMPITKALPELVNQPFPELLRKVFATGNEYHGFETAAYLRRNGILTESYYNFVYAPLKNEGQEVTGILLIASDVTTLVLAKKQLEESERKLRDLINSATVATALYEGDDMVIKLANEAMLKLWGKDAAVIGRPLPEALPELNGQPFLKLLKDVYRTGITYYSKEDRADLNVDGLLQSFYFNFTYKALYDPDGKIYGILNMAVDVTESVNVKIEVHNAEERWRVALQSAELGTWDYYPITKEFMCSPRTKELFGISAETEPTFEMLMEAIPERDRQRVRVEMSTAFQLGSNGKYRIEYPVVGIQDGKERWQRATGQAFYQEDGKPYRLTGTVLDITERKKIEEALEERVNSRTRELVDANKELERSNMELEQYAYVASHDLQEPLRKIQVYSDLLRESGYKHSVQEQSRLEKIISSAQRMSHLIQDLLNFSRLLKTENIFSEVDLNQTIKNIIDDFELKILETNAKITVDVLPVIEASPQQMNQLFYNIISNALKFRKENEAPEIHISASQLTAKSLESYKDVNQSLTYFDIKVSDNGIGFNTKYSVLVFEIFKRLNTRTKYEGTGIGLALCRKIARNHRGDVYAESIEGKGSTFHVLLPIKQSNK